MTIRYHSPRVNSWAAVFGSTVPTSANTARNTFVSGAHPTRIHVAPSAEVDKKCEDDAPADFLPNGPERDGAPAEESPSIRVAEENPRQQQKKDEERREREVHSLGEPFSFKSSVRDCDARWTRYVFPSTSTVVDSPFRAAFMTFRAASSSEKIRRARSENGAFIARFRVVWENAIIECTRTYV